MSSPLRASLLVDYIAGAALWYGALGMQLVIVAWLVMDELASREALGFVRGAGMAPILILLLLGGLIADRVDRRRLIIGLYLTAAVLTATLGFIVYVEALDLWILALYVIAMGSVTAFLQPARDALLSDVVDGDMTRPATTLTMTQFGAQGLGALAAGSAKLLGISTVLGIQAALLLLGLLACWRLPSRKPSASQIGLSFSDAFAGVGEVFRSSTMRSTTLLMVGIGLFFSGAFFVALPLLVYEHHQGDVSALSLVMGVLQAGTVLGAAGLLTLRRIPRRGLALACSLAGASLPIFALSFGLPYLGTLAAVFVWGIFVAGFHSMGRAIIQEAAPEEHRARVLAVYALSMQGAAVIGAPMVGLLAGMLGPLGVFVFCAGAMLLFIGIICLATPVLKVD
ncbi:MAG: MFS transporter [Myxococcales bacterium]|nr:MFS transporter [Myxococcales bacterium]